MAGTPARFMRSEQEDPYLLLGVSTTATPGELRARYLSLAKEWHPDVCPVPEAVQRFQRISAAYQLLRDPDRRAAYDAMRAAVSGAEGLIAYRKQQAARRAAHKQRRNRNSGLGGWWR
jgi:curved DNA-binding protein CbpA